jgi:hypothetical protein
VPDQRHAHPRVGVQHRFDLLRIHLESADIDDPAGAAPEVIAPPDQFHHIAGVDVAVIAQQHIRCGAEIAGGVAARANSQRVIHDLKIDACGGVVDKRLGKSLAPIVDVKRESRLGRSKGMRNAGIRIHRAQIVEQRLVRDLAR